MGVALSIASKIPPPIPQRPMNARGARCFQRARQCLAERKLLLLTAANFAETRAEPAVGWATRPSESEAARSAKEKAGDPGELVRGGGWAGH